MSCSPFNKVGVSELRGFHQGRFHQAVAANDADTILRALISMLKRSGGAYTYIQALFGVVGHISVPLDALPEDLFKAAIVVGISNGVLAYDAQERLYLA